MHVSKPMVIHLAFSVSDAARLEQYIEQTWRGHEISSHTPIQPYPPESMSKTHVL